MPPYRCGTVDGCGMYIQTFVTLGPASLLVFAELLCILSVGVYAALWYLGRHTDKHCGQFSLTSPHLTSSQLTSLPTGAL